MRLGLFSLFSLKKGKWGQKWGSQCLKLPEKTWESLRDLCSGAIAEGDRSVWVALL